MQRGPIRPLMTGCILYLLLLAGLFLLSDFLLLQVILPILLAAAVLFCAWLAGKEHCPLPPLLSSRSFCIGMVIPIVLAVVGAFSVMHDYRALQVTGETAVSVSGQKRCRFRIQILQRRCQYQQRLFSFEARC